MIVFEQMDSRLAICGGCYGLRSAVMTAVLHNKISEAENSVVRFAGQRMMIHVGHIATGPPKGIISRAKRGPSHNP